MDLAIVTGALVASLGSGAAASSISQVVRLMRDRLRDSTRGMEALESIEAGRAPAVDGPEARTIQRILIRKALSDETLKDELVDAYRLVTDGDDGAVASAGGSYRRTTTVLAITDVDVFDASQIAALHKLGITSVADLLGVAKTSKAELARTLRVDVRRFDGMLSAVASTAPTDLLRELEKPIPGHGYGLAIGEG